jgi:hypothetical protein
MRSGGLVIENSVEGTLPDGGGLPVTGVIFRDNNPRLRAHLGQIIFDRWRDRRWTCTVDRGTAGGSRRPLWCRSCGSRLEIGPVDPIQARLDLIVRGNHGDEFPSHGGPQGIEGDDVIRVGDGHHGSTEFPTYGDDVMATSDGYWQQAPSAGVNAVSIEIDKLQVVIAREEPTGCRVAHVPTIGTNRVQIERRCPDDRAWPGTISINRGGTVAARMELAPTK